MQCISAFLPRTRGGLTIGGAWGGIGGVAPPGASTGGGHSWRNPDIYRTVGLVPERDSVYAFLTGEQFVVATAKLHPLADPVAAATRAIAIPAIAAAPAPKTPTYSQSTRHPTN